MKSFIVISAIALSSLGITGCSLPGQPGDNTIGPVVSVAAGVIAKIVSHSAQACADLAALNAQTSGIVNQIAAANPNNANIQKAASFVNNSGAASNNQCQELAAAFTAEAPRSLLTAKIKLDPAVWARIQ